MSLRKRGSWLIWPWWLQLFLLTLTSVACAFGTNSYRWGKIEKVKLRYFWNQGLATREVSYFSYSKKSQISEGSVAMSYFLWGHQFFLSWWLQIWDGILHSLGLVFFLSIFKARCWNSGAVTVRRTRQWAESGMFHFPSLFQKRWEHERDYENSSAGAGDCWFPSILKSWPWATLNLNGGAEFIIEFFKN